MSDAEGQVALDRLLDRLQGWLLQQPELLLLWTQPRQVRKTAARIIATELLTIPVRKPEGFQPNRAMRRQLFETLRHGNPDWQSEGQEFLGKAEQHDVEGTEGAAGLWTPLDEQG